MQRLSTITANQPGPALTPDDRTDVELTGARSPATESSLRRLHDDEEGAQAVEYAMIAGLGAGFIGLLYKIITSTGLIDRVVQALLDALLQLVTSWF
ncbi:MAG: DUF4244 domain-containing protein [Euzebyaceae bacterium]|jgi:Flp pilus assembly pilin Flp|nr:DUF4244 domain-containing protein [Euzebyaceae bacterium]